MDAEDGADLASVDESVTEWQKEGDFMYIHSCVDVAGAVERVEAHNVRAVQMRGREHEVLLFLAVDRGDLSPQRQPEQRRHQTAPRHICIYLYACLAAVLEEVDQGVVRQQVKLLDDIARGVGRPARRPSEPLHRSNRNSM